MARTLKQLTAGQLSLPRAKTKLKKNKLKIKERQLVQLV